MDEVLPTPPASPLSGPHSESHSESDLIRAIDDLLERYLGLLDQQQKLQEAIGKQFANGFFSLARANHSCPPGRRYGEDYYDERMKATKHVEITMNEAVRSKSAASLVDLSSPAFKIETIEIKHDPTTDDNKGAPGNEAEPSGTKAKTKTKSSNPLHWFGILVPPPLRNAQESFSGAVAGPIPALAGVVSEMREVERKVEGLRELLGGTWETVRSVDLEM
ncbi:uncharacterized protein GIQ15_05103 [Arthroderma uncinatum]|uniref:uncharacterized protein n=1 Tax=Arthroderma uncinatum TaxID=74035 RepID=UPI00144A9726|nr:uncharacterized protein GIQ15_05103 [Arthroderma uncinatum]KAF3482344.1 hypothetical protein GIQ15_05103 [Arthroderma uncinatum]